MKTLYSLFAFAFLFAGGVSAQCTDPTPEISGDFSVCQSQSQLYSVDSVNIDNSYVWTLSGGGVLTTDLDQATVVWGNIPGTYQLSLQEIDGTCSSTILMTVVVEDDIVLVCNDNLNISLASSCQLTLTPDIILESPDYEDDSYTIVVRDENNNIISNIVGQDQIGQTLEVSVFHDCSGNVCWGDVTIEDKIPPVVSCFNDTLTCDEFQFFDPADYGSIITDNCQNATITNEVEEQILDCDPDFSRLITITFIAEDLSGNVSPTCVSLIYVEREGINDIDLPLSYDGLAGNNPPLSCSGNYAVDAQGNPSPSVTGTPGGINNCGSVEWTYNDIILPLCEVDCDVNNPSYKVIRQWTILDWCTGEIIQPQQIIKIEDTTAPVISVIADVTATVNPFDCSAQVLLPQPTITDNCSAEISYTYSTDVGSIVDDILIIDAPAKTMGQGIEITVIASDCCGNFDASSFFVRITDNTPPVVVADAHEVISLLPNGTTTMYATSLDDGSYDNCGPIEIGVKRMDNGAGSPPIDIFPPTGNDNAQYNEVVHFYCSDLDGPVMVQLQVCDDASMDGIFGNVNDNCNTAMIEVHVQDKFVPVIQCPVDMTISCVEFESVDLDNQAQIDALFGSAFAAGTCGATITETISGTDDLTCGEGAIFRVFNTVTAGGTASCTQNITVVPFAQNLLTCERISFDGLNNSIYNWCAINDGVNDDDDDLPSIDIDGCEGINVAQVHVDVTGLCTTAGIQVSIDTFVYAGSSACKKYIVHYEVIDQCVFDENFVDITTGQIDPYNTGNGYFEFYLEYNVVDTEAPELTCEDMEFPAEICEGYTGNISIEAVDACTPEDMLFYEFKVDVGSDGTIDIPGSGEYITGSTVNGSALGLSAIPIGEHTILWRVDDGCGNFQTCSQDIIITPETKQPTPYCYGDLSTAVMPSTGTIDIWAVDFDAGSEDNCGAPVLLSMIPMLDLEGLTGEEAYGESFNHPNVTFENGNYGWSFDCSYIPNGVTAVVEIRIYVTDEYGNYDFCTASLRIDDNFDACDDSMTGTRTMEGSIKTSKGENVDLVEVEVFTDLPEFPVFGMSDDTGIFSISELYSNLDYTVSATRNDNYLNGITTLDVILIQKHILGLDPITDNYDLIAADINNDCKITGIDLVQLRRLILGKYTSNELPDNDSWRFVEKEYDFPAGQQPCEYAETTTVFLSDNVTDLDFTGVKIGDINGSVNANFNSMAETRSNKKLSLIVENVELEVGRTYEIPVYARSFDQVYGLQCDFIFNGIEMTSIKPAILDVSDENYHSGQEGSYAFSYSSIQPITASEDDVLFYLVVKSNEIQSLRKALSVQEQVMVSEAYYGENLDIAKVDMIFFDQEHAQEALEFELHQNQPNPFMETTNIAFIIPQSMQASLTIYDSRGQLVYSYSDVFPQGYNVLQIEKAEISSRGVLYYRLETKIQTATKKMMLLE